MARRMVLLCFSVALLGSAPVAAEVDFDELAEAAPVERLRQTLGYFAGLGSRVAGYPGADEAALFVQDNFRQIGLDDITIHEYDVSVPIDKGGYIKVAGTAEKIPLYCIWPNLVRTSTLPEGGLSTQLVDAGQGDYADMDGLDIEGAAVLMDFNTGDAWLNAAYLGASAVVFIEPDSTMYLEGEKKFLSMPLDLPRFWIGKEQGQALRDRIGKDGAQPVHLEYRMDWERRSAWNVMGTIPGYDPLLKEDVVVLEGYYDAMSVVPALAPGA